MPRNLKGEGPQSKKPSVFHPKSSEEQKKRSQHIRRCPILCAKSSEQQKKNGQHVRRCPIFRPKSRKEQKERSSHPSIVLYAYITFPPQKFCAFLCRKGRSPSAPPLDMPLVILKQINLLTKMVVLLK